MGGKKIWWLIGAAALLIAAAFTYAVVNKDTMPDYSQKDENSSQNQGASQAGQNETAGQYLDYSEQNFASAEGERWLFFHAGWCPQCRALEQDIQADGVPQGVTILKVDYDSQTDLKKKYGVTLQTTFVAVDQDGSEVEKFVAYDDPSLDAVVDALGN